MFPLVVRSFGVFATIVGVFFVRGREDEDPMTPELRLLVTRILSVVASAFVTC